MSRQRLAERSDQEKKKMRKLLLIIIVISLFSCGKDKQIGKLPKPLQEVVKNTSCDCDPVITKIFWHNDIYYVMSWVAPQCSIPIKYYDKYGNPFTPMWMTMEAGQFLETVWKCGNK